VVPGLATTWLHTYHWYESDGAGDPCQVPAVATIATVVLDDVGTVGADAFDGAAVESCVPAAEYVVTVPAWLVAVTATIKNAVV
jgi:hypothetical protein